MGKTKPCYVVVFAKVVQMDACDAIVDVEQMLYDRVCVCFGALS